MIGYRVELEEANVVPRYTKPVKKNSSKAHLEPHIVVMPRGSKKRKAEVLQSQPEAKKTRRQLVIQAKIK